MKKKSISAIAIGFIAVIGVAAQSSFSTVLQGIFTPILNLLKDYLISPPDTNITEVSDSNNTSILATKTTFFQPINFTFKGISNFGISYYECRFDDEKEEQCDSPKIITKNLTMGTHRFSVSAIDKLGNKDEHPYVFDFEIKPSYPKTNLYQVKAGDKILNYPNIPIPSYSSKSSISFYFNGTDNERISKFVCTLDAGTIDGEPQEQHCKSPKIYSIKPGTYTFEVKAIDNHGTQDPEPPRYDVELYPAGIVTGVIRTNEPNYDIKNLLVVISNKYQSSYINQNGIYTVPFVKKGEFHDLTVKDNEHIIWGPETVKIDENSMETRKNITLDKELVRESKIAGESDNYTKKNKNPYFEPEPENETLIKPIDLEYIQTSDKINGRWNVTVYINGPMKVVSQIEKVTYYLHPTHDKLIVPQFDKNNRFDLNLNVYGGYKMYAKAFFKEGIVDLSRFILLSEKRDQ